MSADREQNERFTGMSDQNDPRDTEGHRTRLATDEDTEGNMKGKPASDEDTEGHKAGIPY